MNSLRNRIIHAYNFFSARCLQTTNHGRPTYPWVCTCPSPRVYKSVFDFFTEVIKICPADLDVKLDGVTMPTEIYNSRVQLKINGVLVEFYADPTFAFDSNGFVTANVSGVMMSRITKNWNWNRASLTYVTGDNFFDYLRKQSI